MKLTALSDELIAQLTLVRRLDGAMTRLRHARNRVQCHGNTKCEMLNARERKAKTDAYWCEMRNKSCC
ncbi:hypothetical protein PHSY_001989 [Pseudozyma hubeiensis SY62]|uniref:Uncharacterized protein n=1 Tax=Pseudozyma hubeiensis (strain SY62) TaxID=1305764 RepID=R9NZU3_PSEHS|nr:hypothetical protein PHSY_001989 [Pseudozyma hubeiensis SY62]GAC94418.1 hypothetical protein PHSY_001989 [Pseudozyma hubeiensis SY62]